MSPLFMKTHENLVFKTHLTFDTELCNDRETSHGLVKIRWQYLPDAQLHAVQGFVHRRADALG